MFRLEAIARQKAGASSHSSARPAGDDSAAIIFSTWIIRRSFVSAPGAANWPCGRPTLSRRGLPAAGGPRCRIVVIKTDGDRLQERPLSEIGGKGLFVKEIEDALLGGDIDLAVHSSKDMSAVLPDGLTIAGVLPRENPLDAVVLPNGTPGSGPRAGGDPSIAISPQRSA